MSEMKETSEVTNQAMFSLKGVKCVSWPDYVSGLNSHSPDWQLPHLICEAFLHNAPLCSSNKLPLLQSSVAAQLFCSRVRKDPCMREWIPGDFLPRLDRLFCWSMNVDGWYRNGLFLALQSWHSCFVGFPPCYLADFCAAGFSVKCKKCKCRIPGMWISIWIDKEIYKSGAELPNNHNEGQSGAFFFERVKVNHLLSHVCVFSDMHYFCWLLLYTIHALYLLHVLYYLLELLPMRNLLHCKSTNPLLQTINAWHIPRVKMISQCAISFHDWVVTSWIIWKSQIGHLIQETIEWFISLSACLLLWTKSVGCFSL